LKFIGEFSKFIEEFSKFIGELLKFPNATACDAANTKQAEASDVSIFFMTSLLESD